MWDEKQSAEEWRVMTTLEFHPRYTSLRSPSHMQPYNTDWRHFNGRSGGDGSIPVASIADKNCKLAAGLRQPQADEEET